MTKDDMEIVSAVRRALADKVGKHRFELWFSQGTRLEWDGHALLIGVPNRFFLEWIRSNFRRHLETACQETVGHCPPITFCVDDSAAEGLEESASTAPTTSGATSSAPPSPGLSLGRSTRRNAAPVEEAKTATPAPPAEEGKESAPARRPLASLSSFIVGQCNRLAAVSAEMVAQNPGRITPVVFHGPTSVGKTHLLEGICTAARRSGRGGSTLYLSAEQFTSQFVEALRGSGLPSFRRKYRGVSLLILDDLHFLAGKRATQVELLHTIDTLLRDGRQLVFATDRPPSECPDMAPELITRLASGMVCRIDPPDFTTRVGIVQQLARRLNVSLPEEVQRFVAARLTTHARELSGAICRLQATAEATGQPITLELADEALSEMIQRHSRVVRLADIQKAVCQVFGLETASLQSDTKSKRLSHPRMLAMWLARKHTRAALSEIGQFFGRRSHSTVISAQKRVDQWMAAGIALHLAEQTWQVDEAVRQVERELLAG